MAPNTRWSYTATVDANDKMRLRGFVRNEINYYNALLTGFASRLRTAPDVFTEVSESLVGVVAALGCDLRTLSEETLPQSLMPHKKALFENGKLLLSERALFLLDVVASPIVLHPETKRAMATEVLREHIRHAAALSRTSKAFDQVLAGPVELLHQTDQRIKRHVQLPKCAIFLNEDRTEVRTAYNGTPLRLSSPLPKDATWNLAIIRDDERPGHHQGGQWTIEFRQERADFLPRLSDTPFMKKKGRKVPAR